MTVTDNFGQGYVSQKFLYDYHRELKSSFLNAVWYNSVYKTLLLKMESGWYLYHDVPWRVYNFLVEASSPGRIYGEYIKGKFTSQGIFTDFTPVKMPESFTKTTESTYKYTVEVRVNDSVDAVLNLVAKNDHEALEQAEQITNSFGNEFTLKRIYRDL